MAAKVTDPRGKQHRSLPPPPLRCHRHRPISMRLETHFSALVTFLPPFFPPFLSPASAQSHVSFRTCLFSALFSFHLVRASLLVHSPCSCFHDSCWGFLFLVVLLRLLHFHFLCVSVCSFSSCSSSCFSFSFSFSSCSSSFVTLLLVFFSFVHFQH